MKNKWVMIVAATVMSVGAASANELQLREASEHLVYLSRKRDEARVKLSTARRAYKAIDSAYDSERRVVKSLRKAIKSKEDAERKARSAAEIAQRYDRYLADRSHASGGVTDYAY